MDERMWALLLEPGKKGVASLEGYQLVLLTELLEEMHRTSDTLLDQLERVYTRIQQLGITREQIRAVPETIYAVQSGDFSSELAEKRYKPFWTDMDAWLDTIGIHDIRIVEIGLSVLSSKDLEPLVRKKTLREEILGVFSKVAREVPVEGAEAHPDILPPRLPPYFPLAMDANTYIKDCIAELKQYTVQVEQIYVERGGIKPEALRAQRDHIHLMAEYLIQRLPYRALEAHLKAKAKRGKRRGLSFNNIAVAVGNLAKRMDVQLPEF